MYFEWTRVLAEDNNVPLDGNCFQPPEFCVGSEGDTSSLWYVGVIVSIFGSVASNFGVNTQKYSMIQEIRTGRERPYARQPIWLLGMILVILGAVADFGALGFAAQSLITPVGGFTMVANLFFASMWLGEKITRLDFMSTFLIIGGIILIAAFADKSAQCFTLENLKCLYKRKQFKVYAVFVGAAILGMYLLIVWLRRKTKKMKEESKTDTKQYERLIAILPLACATLSGLIGAQSVLFAKSVIEILKSQANGSDDLKSGVSWLIIFAMLSAIFGQIHWLATGLSQFDAVVIVPVFQSVFVTFTIIAGASYFGEFRNFNQLQTTFFPIGVLVLLAGVLGLAKHKSRTPEELLEAEVPSVSTYDSRSRHDSEATALDEYKRRESFHRLEEFNRLSPYGAITGQWIPLEMLLSGVDRGLERVGTFLQRANSFVSVEEERRRRTSLPVRTKSTATMARSQTEEARPNSPGERRERTLPVLKTEMSSSFAQIEGKLNFGSTRNLDDTQIGIRVDHDDDSDFSTSDEEDR